MRHIEHHDRVFFLLNVSLPLEVVPSSRDTAIHGLEPIANHNSVWLCFFCDINSPSGTAALEGPICPLTSLLPRLGRHTARVDDVYVLFASEIQMQVLSHLQCAAPLHQLNLAHHPAHHFLTTVMRSCRLAAVSSTDSGRDAL